MVQFTSEKKIFCAQTCKMWIVIISIWGMPTSSAYTYYK